MVVARVTGGCQVGQCTGFGVIREGQRSRVRTNDQNSGRAGVSSPFIVYGHSPFSSTMDTSYSPLLTSDTDHDTSSIHPLLPHDLTPGSLLDTLDITLHPNTIHLVQDEQDGGSQLARAWGGNGKSCSVTDPCSKLMDSKDCIVYGSIQI
jgi:hypothetical protein